MTRKQFERSKRYLAAISVARHMLDLGLICEQEYSALETKFAAHFPPLVRYEKPCFHAVTPVTQTVEGRVFYEPNHTESPAEHPKDT